MIRKFVQLLATVLAVAMPLAAGAQVSPGTTLYGNIDQNLSSNHVWAGEQITLSNVHSSNNNINGGVIYGHVASYQAAGQGRPGKIQLAFDRLRTRSGSVYAISGYATNVDVQTKKNTLKEVGGAAAGALVGGLLFHGVGALLGAAGGALVAKNNRQNVSIPQGSQVSVQIVRSRRQS